MKKNNQKNNQNNNNKYLLVSTNTCFVVLLLSNNRIHLKKCFSRKTKKYGEEIKDIAFKKKENIIYSIHGYDINTKICKWDGGNGELLLSIDFPYAEKIILENDSIFVRTDLDVYKCDKNLNNIVKIVTYNFIESVHIDGFALYNNKLYIGTNNGMDVYDLQNNFKNSYKNFPSSKYVILKPSIIIAASSDGESNYNSFLEFINLNNYTRKKIKAYKSPDVVEYISISNDSKYIVTISELSLIKIWDAKTYKLLKKFNVSNKYVRKAFFSENNKYLYLVGDGLIKYVLNLECVP